MLHLKYACQSKEARVLELFSGFGLLTAFLAGSSLEVIGIEENPEAVADLAVNLADFDNIVVYQGRIEDIVSGLSDFPETIVLQPPKEGLNAVDLDAMSRAGAKRLIYVGQDLATTARDSRRLIEKGFQLTEVQPVDVRPHHYQVLTILLWERARGFDE